MGARGRRHPADLVAGGHRWKRVLRPQAWRPDLPGQVLTGEYAGRQERDGEYGPYGVLLVQTSDGVFYASGTRLMDLLDGAGHLPLGTPVRVVFGGRRERQDGDGYYKLFELYVGMP